MNKNTSYKLVSIAVCSLVICFAVAFYAFGWTEPTATPPAGNVSAPLNVSSTGQSKTGGLILNTGGAANGLIVQTGNVGIGVTPTQKLDVNGTTKTTGLQITTGAGAGKVLTSDASGTATWQASGGTLQQRVTGTCSTSQAIRVINTDGTVSCASMPVISGGGITNLSSPANSGITLNPNPITSTGTISADTNYLQRRVTGDCSAGQAIASINSSGGVVCTSLPIIPCTWGSKTYTNGSRCETGSSGGGGITYIYYSVCQSDGSWTNGQCTYGTGCPTLWSCGS